MMSGMHRDTIRMRRFRRFLGSALVGVLVACGGDSGAGPDGDDGDAYALSFETRNASGWFGGDDQPASQRNVAIAQSVLIPEAITLQTFSFFLTSPFYSASSGEDPQAGTVVLHVRSDLGTIRRTLTATVPADFPAAGGWVTWNGINLDVAAGTTLIFSAFLQGGFAQNQVTSGYGAHTGAGFAGGELRIKSAESDALMEPWTGWTVHQWDAVFRLTGVRQ